jgi:hypothetical protein
MEAIELRGRYADFLDPYKNEDDRKFLPKVTGLLAFIKEKYGQDLDKGGSISSSITKIEEILVSNKEIEKELKEQLEIHDNLENVKLRVNRDYYIIVNKNLKKEIMELDQKLENNRRDYKGVIGGVEKELKYFISKAKIYDVSRTIAEDGLKNKYGEEVPRDEVAIAMIKQQRKMDDAYRIALLNMASNSKFVKQIKSKGRMSQEDSAKLYEVLQNEATRRGFYGSMIGESEVEISFGSKKTIHNDRFKAFHLSHWRGRNQDIIRKISDLDHKLGYEKSWGRRHALQKELGELKEEQMKLADQVTNYPLTIEHIKVDNPADLKKLHKAGRLGLHAEA